MKNNATTSTYVHIPFCTKKCGYCSFLSYETLELKNIYIDALLIEIKKFYNATPQKTLYIGGGTPSLLGLGDFEEIFSQFNFEKNHEITVEINPNNIREEYLKGLKNLGANRLSIGVQSFDDNILKTIGRSHNTKDVHHTINYARRAGFNNISIDLIYGLPNQNLKNWEKTLKTALTFAPEHISLYGLKIDKGCYFYKNKPENLANEDLQADMYLAALNILGDYEHYEVSNFALRAQENSSHPSGLILQAQPKMCENPDGSGELPAGFETVPEKAQENFSGKHNLNYWKLGFYNGFGVGASGFSPKGRYNNTNNIEKYIKNPLNKTYEKNNPQSFLEEEIFLGFRLLEGINTNYINQKYNINFEKKFAPQLEKFIPTGHILKTKIGYKLSTEGILLSNSVLCEFI